GNRRDKLIIEYDPEIEKTLKKNRSRVKAQRALQFEKQEAEAGSKLRELFSSKNKKQIRTKVLLKNFLKKR
ncbi:hypothetical protein PIB30_110953, partial [Stylosanthes scabra]|nr:hypothetical protein [Stylosanthes scabra]